jgi:hypothetical protein
MGDEADTIFEVRVGEPWSKAARDMLKNKLSLSHIVSGSRREKVLNAKVLVFTGHHWVQHGEPPGAFHPMAGDGTPETSKGINLTTLLREKGDKGHYVSLMSDSTKLVIVSGCYVLGQRSAKYFHKTFPKATVLGFAGSATKRKGVFYEKFLERLPEGLDVDSAEDMKTIVDTWRQFIEDASADPSLRRGATSDPTLRQPGYMLPDGTIVLWRKLSKKWVTKSISDTIEI